MLVALNFLDVLIYGVLIMAFLLDIKWDLKNVLPLLAFVVFNGLLQLVLLMAFGGEFVEKSYPLVIHLPLVLLFCWFYKKRFVSVLFVLFTAYVLTTPRRWIGEVVAFFFHNDPTISILTQIIASVVLLVLVYRFLRPFVSRILGYRGAQILLLTVMPALYYAIVYATTVYTDLFYRSSILIAGLVGVGLNFCFYSFLTAYFNEMERSFVSRTEQTILQMQVDATARQMEEYKNAQTQAAIYRHDLRHHLQYISGCIAQRHLDEAQSYIAKISSDTEGAQFIRYCENMSVNLLLSTYVTRAQNSEIGITVQAAVPAEIPIQSTDICVILSNGIENAIRACRKIASPEDRTISISCRYDNHKLMMEIRNTYHGEITFNGDLPSATEENHGLGTRSIKAAVQKYGGIYSFTVENGIFTMRVILQ